MKQLKLSIRQNAYSFLEDAIANAIAAEREPKRWKFAILSIVQSIELCLKQLLADAHPLLIYENVDRATRTVGLEQAIKRLAQVNKLKLSKEEEEALQTAKRARDEITHYEVDQNITHLKLAFSRLLGFLSDFYAAHFSEPIYQNIDKALWKKGLAIKEYGEELHQRAIQRLGVGSDSEDIEVTSCPVCSWRPLIIEGGGIGTCYVCGYHANFVFCSLCVTPTLAEDAEESGPRLYCQKCFEYVSSDYWHETRAGK